MTVVEYNKTQNKVLVCSPFIELNMENCFEPVNSRRCFVEIPFVGIDSIDINSKMTFLRRRPLDDEVSGLEIPNHFKRILSTWRDQNEPYTTNRGLIMALFVSKAV